MDASSLSVTVGDTVDFSSVATGGSGGYSHSWALGDGGTSDLQDPSHIYDSAGVKTVTYTVKDSDNAEASATLTITVLNRPLAITTLNAEPLSVVVGDAVSFSSTASGGTGEYIYDWLFGDETSFTSQDTTHIYKTAGIYTVTCMVTDSAGESVSNATITIIVSNPPVLSTYDSGGSAPGGDGSVDGGGCFIATAAFGSYLDPNVMVLRNLRDKYLLTNEAGKTFVRLYYKYSPPLADYINQHEILRIVSRYALTPLIYGFKFPLASIVFLVASIFCLLGYLRKRGNIICSSS